MPQKTTETILNELFSKLNNILAPADLTPNAPPPLSFVTMMLPGITVHAKDFDSNTESGRDNLFRMMDRLPAANKQYLDSGRRCSDMYSQILSAAAPVGDPAKAQALKAKYQEAQAYLRGQEYKDYKNYRKEYNRTRNKFLRLQNGSETNRIDLAEAKEDMTEAMDDWIALGYKKDVEAALTVCQNYLSYTPEAVFAAAGQTFEQAKDTVTGLYPVTCTPSSWAVKPDELSWTDVVIKQGSSEDKLHSDTKQIDSDFSANFAYGLWHASASGGYHDRTERLNKSSSVDKLGMSFQIARVELSRDWFTSSLITYPGTTVAGRKAGSLCAGSLAKAADCDFPFLPTAVVVARNINIYNEFSSEEENFFNEAKSWSASAQVGYGPFSIGNNTSYTRNLTDQEKKEFGNAVKLSVGQGMQIIGFLNTVLTPAFPSADQSATVTALKMLDDYQLNSARSYRPIVGHIEQSR